MFQLKFYNLFWYFAFYGLLSLILLKKYGKEKQKKVLAYTDTPTKLQKYSVIVSTIVRFAAMIVSIFVPVQLGTYSLIIGHIVYLLGTICSTIALYQYLNANLDKPIISGIYQYSRHPMQVFYAVMLVGMTILSRNLIFGILTVLYAISFYPSFEAQENFCVSKYGKLYKDYMSTTARILQIKK